MDKLPVGQLPDLQQSNNDDEIMVITNSEYNQLKKEKISDLITDFTSTDENNAIVKGTDGKLFTKDFGNASNITEGTLPTSVLPDIPKSKLPDIETADLPVSGVTADTYAYPSSVTVNAQGQVTAIEAGEPGANNANQDLSNISEAGKEVIRQNSGAGMPVGTIITSNASSSYTPENTVYTDGTEYAEAQFAKTYSLLESGQLESCTYEEYENSITQTGECWICALDTANQKFKVPTIKDIVVRGIKDTIEVEYGKGVKRSTGEDVSGQPVDIAVFGPVSGGYASLLNVGNTNNGVVGVSSELGNSALQADTQDSLITQTIRHYYVVATGSINQSEMDWSQWASSLEGKANTDLGNLNATGKEEITNLCLPDYNSGIDITSNLKTPPYSYTAPTNGIIRFLAGGDVEWIIANSASATNDNSANILVNINGMAGVNISTMLQVEKNKTIYDIGAHDGTSAIFYPLKGVEND